MKTVTATRYVTPLREGGSLPAIAEADDSGLYVVKFRGAGQGTKALVAELVAGELARAAGLRVPEIALVDVCAALGRNEADPEIRELLKRSVGSNLGLDFLPGSVSFDPAVGPPPTAAEASEILWLDAFVSNVDRTARNTNLLTWHRRLWLIDHGAALYFHHDWARHLRQSGAPPATAGSAAALVEHHVLLPWAGEIEEAGRRLRSRLSRDVLRGVLAEVPDGWLPPEPGLATPEQHRAAYLEELERRLTLSYVFEEEALRAREACV